MFKKKKRKTTKALQKKLDSDAVWSSLATRSSDVGGFERQHSVV
jgi:hypothetical protein